MAALLIAGAVLQLVCFIGARRRGLSAELPLLIQTPRATPQNDPDPELWIPVYLIPGLLTLYSAARLCAFRALSLLPAKLWLSASACVLAIAILSPLKAASTALTAEGVHANLLEHEGVRELSGALLLIAWCLRCAAVAARPSLPGSRWLALATAPFLLPMTIAALSVWWFAFAERVRLGGAACGSPPRRDAELAAAAMP